MTKFTALLSNKTQKQLDKFSNSLAKPILKAIADLELNPRPQGCKKLSGREGYRIRIGSYRIIYKIIDNQLIINIITLGHRKDIYD